MSVPVKLKDGKTYSSLYGVFYVGDQVRGPVLAEMRHLLSRVENCDTRISEYRTCGEKYATHGHKVRVQLCTALVISVELLHPSSERWNERLVAGLRSGLLP